MASLLDLLDADAAGFYKEVSDELHINVIADLYDDDERLKEWASRMISRDCPTGDLELVRMENGAKREPGDGLDRREINLVFVFGRTVTLEDLNREAENGFRTTLRQTA